MCVSNVSMDNMHAHTVIPHILLLFGSFYIHGTIPPLPPVCKGVPWCAGELQWFIRIWETSNCTNTVLHQVKSKELNFMWDQLCAWEVKQPKGETMKEKVFINGRITFAKRDPIWAKGCSCLRGKIMWRLHDLCLPAWVMRHDTITSIDIWKSPTVTW